MANIDVYVAGLIDGEGCVYVMSADGRKTPGSRSFYPVVEVGMTQKALTVLRLLHREYGGILYEMRPATEKWDAAWTWKLHGSAAAAALTRWQPYLQLKQEQARLAILVETIRKTLPMRGPKRVRWTDEAAERCAIIRERIKELNRKGPMEPFIPEPPCPGAKLTALRVAGQWVTPQGDLFSDLGLAPFTGPWPTSGIGGPRGFWTLNMPEFPKDAVASSLSDILEEPGPHLEKYFLSPRAATGILRRAAKRGRVLPGALQTALEALARSAPSGATGQEAAGA